MAELDRIRWQCRRGMLELDLILDKFNQKHLASLDFEQVERFQELLVYPDNDLLELLMERGPAPEHRYIHILHLLRTA